MQHDSATSVYLYYDEHDILIYVGITSRGIKRQTEHNRSKDWWRYVTRQDVEHYDSRADALARETDIIVRHAPPFNTQQNANHAAARASYLAFRQLPEVAEDPADTLRRIGRQVPLAVVHHDGNDLTLVTPPRYAHLAAHLTATKELRTLVGTTRCGRLTEAVKRGPTLHLTFNIRKGVPVDRPFVRVKMVPTKAGMEYHARNVQLAA